MVTKIPERGYQDIFNSTFKNLVHIIALYAYPEILHAKHNLIIFFPRVDNDLIRMRRCIK